MSVLTSPKKTEVRLEVRLGCRLGCGSSGVDMDGCGCKRGEVWIEWVCGWGGVVRVRQKAWVKYGWAGGEVGLGGGSGWGAIGDGSGVWDVPGGCVAFYTLYSGNGGPNWECGTLGVAYPNRTTGISVLLLPQYLVHNVQPMLA